MHIFSKQYLLSIFKFSTKHLLAIIIGAPIFFLIGRFLSFTFFESTYVTLSYAVLSIFAIFYGPIVGLFIGIIGHWLIDVTLLMIYWSWIITSGIVGFAFGIVFKPGTIQAGEFGKNGALRFIISCLIIHMIAWGMIAPVLDLIMYDKSASYVFRHGIIAGLSNFSQTAIIGTTILFAYTITRKKSDNLDKTL